MLDVAHLIVGSLDSLPFVCHMGGEVYQHPSGVTGGRLSLRSVLQLVLFPKAPLSCALPGSEFLVGC